MTPTQTFQAARDVLLAHRTDYEAALREYRAPQLERFNWALDWFDVLARGNAQTALWIIDEAGEKRFTFEEMRVRSNRAANFLRAQGVQRGERILLMLPNIPALWEVMLGAMKLGAVLIPATTQLTPADLRDRLERGQVKHVITEPAGAAKVDELKAAHTRLVVGGEAKGWRRWEELEGASADFQPQGDTHASDPLLLYFTSGTTAKPKLVLHTQQSYPVGHLSTMYWIGLQPGDIHWNISSPGWAKHAWSNVFAPWNAGATVFIYSYTRFSAPDVLGVLERCRVTTLCAPPTVWRMLILADLSKAKVHLREAVSAGEPLNPEVIERVRSAWGLTIRDGFGQTETTCQVGNSPGQPLKPGSMGRPLPGYDVRLLDADGQPAEEGELCLSLNPRPLGLMVGYQDDADMTASVTRDGHYHTGDVAARDAQGYLTYVGRADDVFKASDYRISPFELESVLIEHPAVAEAALVPSPDAVRLAVPKAFVVLKPGFSPSKELARDILAFARQRLAPYKRVRRLEFSELPKTISGKIRRVELRVREMKRPPDEARGPNEYWAEDFPELRG
jgi:acetyl-CoA synthetase